MTTTKKTSKEKATSGVTQESIDTAVVHATRRLNCLSEIIDKLQAGGQSPCDAFTPAYTLHESEYEPEVSLPPSDFCFDELPELLLPVLREARQRYLKLVTELMAGTAST